MIDYAKLVKNGNFPASTDKNPCKKWLPFAVSMKPKADWHETSDALA